MSVRVLVVAAIFWAAESANAAPPPASETFKSLRAALTDDKQRQDWNAFLADARRLATFVNDSPTSHLEIARAHLQLGQREEAATELRRYLAAGQINPILDAPLFEPLKARFAADVKANRAPVSRSRKVFALADSGVLPEDIDYDAKTRRFFITSVLEHAILSVDRSGAARIFARSARTWPMLAVKIDAKRRRLWATEVAFEGFAAVPREDWGKSALLEFDLDRGRLLSRHESPGTALGDLVLVNGEPVVSDGNGGGVFRLRAGKLGRIDRGDFISPQTIAACEGGHVYVPDYVRGIAAFNLENGEVRWLSSARFALSGIDGLYCRGDELIAVQNGSSPARVVSFRLDAARTSIASENIIERATPTLGEPTHGVFVDGEFCYIANSGWEAIDDAGRPSKEKPMTPATLRSM